MRLADGKVLQGSVKLGHRERTGDVELSPKRCRRAATSCRFSFSGILNDKLHGFYRSTYKDANGQEKPLASTQFESTDARRAFPCWDEPAFKAVYQVTLVVDEKLTAISNARVVRETALPGTGKKASRFRRHDQDVDLSRRVHRRRIRGDRSGAWWAMRRCAFGPCREKNNSAAFAVDIGKASLEHFSRYYGIPYPGRQTGFDRDSRFCLRRDGKSRRDHLSRNRAAGRSPREPRARSSNGWPTWCRTKMPTCGSAIW